MPTWQERLRARLSKLAVRAVGRVVERLVPRTPERREPEPEPESEPEPEPKRQRATRKARQSAGSTPADVEARRLLEELSSMSSVMADMRRRLAELGYDEAAKGVGGVGRVREEEEGQKEEERRLREEERKEEERKREEDKKLMIPPSEPDSPFQGSAIHLPFMRSDAMFRVLVFEWNKAKIGSPRDDSGRPVDPSPRFAPYAIARASATDPGKTVPVGALRSLDKFREWASEEGFGNGMSLRIEGLVKPPGYEGRSRAEGVTWTASAESQAGRVEGFSFTPSSVPFDPKTQKGKPGR